MDKIYVHGRIPLRGQIRVQGSKNAALPILAATLLTEETCVLHNCPRIADVEQMQNILRHFGCEIRREGTGIKVSGRRECMTKLLFDEVSRMRCSVVLLGALIGKCKKVQLPYPGGCAIGQRPIDIHIQALQQLNIQILCLEEHMIAQTDKLVGNTVNLPFPSVGATENLMMAAVLAEGTTKICGAAKEPEIVALGQFLQAMGAKITGLGESVIEIEGVEKLSGTSFRIPPDRIVAGTYMLACMATGGNILLQDVPLADMNSVFDALKTMGGSIQTDQNQVYLQAPERIQPIPFLKTQVHPGFPTDLQSPLLSCLCLADGVSIIREDIFEQRFHVVPELQRMGAHIELPAPNLVRIEGVECLKGNQVFAKELRGGAALVVAGLGAKGQSSISGRAFIDRGYANICKDLRDLGARIYSV